MMDQRIFDNLKAVEKMLSSCKSYVKKVRTGTRRKGLMTIDWNHFLSTQMAKVQETLTNIQSSILGHDIDASVYPITNGHTADSHGHGHGEMSDTVTVREATCIFNDDAQQNEQKLQVLRSQLIACEEKCNGLEEKLRKITMENQEFHYGRNDVSLGTIYKNTVDLNDENIPTTIAEKMRELYDNEWKASLEKLATHMTESDSIQTLLRILQNCNQFCQKTYYQWKICLASTTHCLTGTTREMQIPTSYDNVSPDSQRKVDSTNQADTKGGRHISRIRVGVTITGIRNSASPTTTRTETPMLMPDLPPGCDDLITQLQKCTGKSLQLQIQKMFFAQIQEEDIPQGTKVYAERCIELCWLMCLQIPSVVLKSDLSRGDKLNIEQFVPYTKAGETVEFLVWPAVFLQSDGPILTKGVVQCK